MIGMMIEVLNRLQPSSSMSGCLRRGGDAKKKMKLRLLLVRVQYEPQLVAMWLPDVDEWMPIASFSGFT